nr:MAG TPA: hypothetical protein [Caudoviricetes sp.]
MVARSIFASPPFFIVKISFTLYSSILRLSRTIF